MRVLMVSAAVLPYWKCGVANVVSQLTLELQRMGNEIAYFALDIEEGKDRVVSIGDIACWMAAPVIQDKTAYMPDEQPGVQHIADRFAACLEQFRPDIVHFHTPQYFGLSLFEMAKKAHARVVMTLHDWWWMCPTQFFSPRMGQICSSPEKRACIACMKKNSEGESAYNARCAALEKAEQQVDCFICVSRILHDDLVRIRPGLKDRAVIIANPVPARTDRFPEPEGPVTFAFLGGQTELKGYVSVMKAFRMLPPELDWRLNIYGCSVQMGKGGASVQGGMARKLQKYILHPVKLFRKVRIILMGMRTEHEQKGKLQKIRHFPFFSEEMRTEILSKTHVVLMCSQVKESFSLVTYEAMGNGCCVIATPCGGPEAIVSDGVNGIMLKDFKVQTLKQAVQHLIAHRELLERCRRNAYEMSKAFEGIKPVAEEYYSVYCGKRSEA